MISPRRRRGFTIVELLVVIAILAVLMALLLPALSKARAQALRVQCASNMRQWGIALREYAVFNRNSFPYNGPPIPPGIPVGGVDLSWNSTVVQQFWEDYLLKNHNLRERSRENVLFCPSQTWHREEQNDATLAGGLMGYFYLPFRDPTTVTLDYTPAGTGWVTKTTFGGEYRLAPIMADMQQYSSINNSWARYSSHLKNGIPVGGNFMFEDGHVSWYDFSAISLGARGGPWLCYYKIDLGM